MLQGLTGYCSMPGMAAVAVAWENQPSGVCQVVWIGFPVWLDSLFLALSQLLVLLDPQARRGRGGRATEKGVGEQWSSHVTACRLGLVDLLGLCCFFGGCGLGGGGGVFPFPPWAADSPN